MAKKTITLHNDFHGRTVNIFVELITPQRGFITEKRAQLAHDRLCGSATCQCGNALGMRPAWQPSVGLIVPTEGGYLVDLA